MSEEKRKIKFWDCNDGAETLSHDEIDEAIEYHLDGLPELLEGTVTVYGYAPVKVNWHSGSDIMERILESLDIDYGPPDDYTKPTENMIGAANKLSDIIKKEYEVWACEVVTEKEIDIKEWIKENKPDWIEELNKDKPHDKQK